MLSGVEIRRKLVHLISLSIPIGYALTSRATALSVLIPLSLAFLLVDVLRHVHPGTASLFRRYFFGIVLREKEENTLMGSTYFLLSSTLVILLFPRTIAIVSLLILVISDTCAAWVGKTVGRVHLLGKTLEGSLAFLVSGLLIVSVYPGLNRFAGGLGVLGATLVELLPIRVDDNFSIPLVAGGIMLALGG